MSAVIENDLQAAIGLVSKMFDDGYARAHPELIGALVQAAAIDRGVAAIVATINDVHDPLRDAKISALFRRYKFMHANDGYIIRKDGVVVCTQPTEELAIEWINQECDAAVKRSKL